MSEKFLPVEITTRDKEIVERLLSVPFDELSIEDKDLYIEYQRTGILYKVQFNKQNNPDSEQTETQDEELVDLV